MPSDPNNMHPDDYEAVNFKTSFKANNAKALTLRELYYRQLGNCLGVYRNLVFGTSRDESPYSSPQNRIYAKYKYDEYIKSMEESKEKNKNNAPKQSCLRKVSSLPATDYMAAFTTKDETNEEKQLRRNRVSYDCELNDKDEMDTIGSHKSNLKNKTSNSQDQRQRRNSSKSRNIGSRLSLIFSIEDMTTDSTSILKDIRHPSISTISGNQSNLGQNSGTRLRITYFFILN